MSLAGPNCSLIASIFSLIHIMIRLVEHVASMADWLSHCRRGTDEAELGLVCIRTRRL
jgi:hypothetical protein